MSFLAGAAARRIGVLLIAAVTDLGLGDPPGLWHPVQGIGTLISGSETVLRRLFKVPWPQAGGKEKEVGGAESPVQEVQKAAGEVPAQKAAGEVPAQKAEKSLRGRARMAGAVMVVLVLTVSTGAAAALLLILTRLHPLAGMLAEGILCGRLLALRSLGEAGFSVRDPLMKGDVEAARRAVSMIVGRDTQPLDAEGIAKAAVETVAENTSDGVTAPLFYMILFGGAGGMFYKAVNTMDSMTGYRNDRYRDFGTAAARLDDVMNFIPSRLTALLMILSCAVPFPGALAVPQSAKMRLPDRRAAMRVWKRDRLKSPSPNSAQTESVCAGALHLFLLGDTWYFGELHHKAQIGDGGRSVEPQDITRAVHLMARASALLFAAGIAALGIIRLM